jgi:hypothetical protein
MVGVVCVNLVKISGPIIIHSRDAWELWALAIFTFWGALGDASNGC